MLRINQGMDNLLICKLMSGNNSVFLGTALCSMLHNGILINANYHLGMKLLC